MKYHILFLLVVVFCCVVSAGESNLNKVYLKVLSGGPVYYFEGYEDETQVTVNGSTGTDVVEVKYDKPFEIKIKSGKVGYTPAVVYLSGCRAHFKHDGIVEANPSEIWGWVDNDYDTFTTTWTVVRPPETPGGPTASNLTGLANRSSIITQSPKEEWDWNGGGQSNCNSCSGGGSGATSPPSPTTGAAMNIGLGRDEEGYSLGNLVFEKSSVADGLVSRQDFELATSADGTSAVYSGGAIRQVISNHYIIDLIEDGSEIVARVYDISAQGALVAGIYQIAGEVLVEHRFTGLPTDGVTGAGVRVVKTFDGGAEESRELRATDLATNRSWKAIDELGKVIEGAELVEIDPVDTAKWSREVQIIKKTAAPGNEILSQVTDSYISGPKGEVLQSSTEGNGPESRTTFHQYYGYDSTSGNFSATVAEGGILGKLEYVTHPDGSWEKYKYDTAGNIHKTYRPWLDGPATPDLATDSNCRLILTAGGNRTEKILDQVISTETSTYGATARVLIPGGAHFDAYGEATIRTIAGPKELKSANYSYGSQTVLSVSENGDASFDYPKQTGNWEPETGTFSVASGGNATMTWQANVYRDGSATGVQYLMEPFRTKRTVSIEVGGRLIKAVEQVLKPGDTWGASFSTDADSIVTDYEFDAQGRQMAIIRDGNIVSSTEHHSPLSRTETDAHGVSTLIISSEDGNTETREQNGITTVTATTGGLTRTTTTTTTAEGLSRNFSTSITNDILGRTSSSTDAYGRTTTYNYPNELTTVETAPGNVVTTTVNYLDGQTKSVVTTGGPSQYFTYAVSPAGEITTTIGSSASSPVRWSSRTANGLGEVTSEARSGPNANTVTTTHAYDGASRRTSSSTPDLAPRLTQYNIYGEAYRQGSDTNANGLLDETSADPLTESLTSYVKINGSWWRETVNRVWVKNDDANTVDTTTQRTRLNTGAGSETQTLDRFNNLTTTVTSVDRAAAKVTRTTTSNLSNLIATETIIAGRLVSATTLSDSNPTTYTYDDFGRVETVTDPRTGNTTYTYNDFDQPLTVTDGLAKTTTYSYYPVSHINAGQLKSTTDPTQKTIYNAYDAFGRLTHTWGATYPVRYEYNADGQRTVMHTYRDFGATTDQLPAAFSTSGDTTVWTYDDASGLLEEKADATNQKTLYTYTNAGLPLTRTWARNITTTYGHDAFGKVTSTIYSDDTPDTARTYDRAGRPLTISGGPGGTRTFDHTGPTTETYSGGLLDEAVIVDSRDTFGRHTGQSLTLGGQPVATTAYTYSLSNRLDGAALAANGQTISTGYGYHPTRGYLQITATGLVSQSAITTTGNLYLPPATETLSYDPDGNLQSDGRWSYTWDAENRLIAMQTHPSAIAAGIPIKRVEYQYDADSRRIARAEPVWDSANATFQPDLSPTRYIWKNWTLLAEFTLEASLPKITKTYLWGLDLAETLDQTGNVGNLLAIVDQTGPTPITLLPAYDSNGNIISLTDAATATKAITYEYDAFGQQVIKTNHAALENKTAALIEAAERNQWSFSTKPEDRTTGLHYYGYRFYDSTAGRWPSRDPIGERGGFNLYKFIGNDALDTYDILGQYEGDIFLLNQKMTIDADGAPTVYHPDGIGLDYLMNGGFPSNRVDPTASYTECPYGVTCKRLKSGRYQPYIQGVDGAKGPASGYFISATSWSQGPQNDQDSFVNSSTIPYIVVKSRSNLGKLVSVVQMDGSFPIVNHGVAADTNGRTDGEASMAMAELFGVPSSPKNGGNEKKKFCYIIYDVKTTFPGGGALFEGESLYERLPKDPRGFPCECKKK